MSVYRALVRLLPRAFRELHGEAIMETLEAKLDTARKNGQAIGTTWLREILDLAATVVRLRVEGAGTIASDVRIALRGLGRHASFSAPAIGTLALAIGAVTTIWSLVYGVLLRPLPFPDADRIVLIWRDFSALREAPNQRFVGLGMATTRNVEFSRVSDYVSFAENADQLDGVGAYNGYIETIRLAPGAQPLLLNGGIATASLFDVVGIRFLMGRGFVAAEGDAGAGAGGAAPVVVLSDALWRTRFGASPDVIGRTVYLSGGWGLIDEGPLTAHEVVGVAPPELRYLAPDIELWVPVALTGESLERPVSVVGRIPEEISIAAVEPSLGALIRSWSPEQLQKLAGVPPADRVTLETLYDNYAGFAGRRLLLPLGAAGLVLLLACANVANLLLSRLPARRQELGMRLALGASRGRLLAQLLTESAVLAVVSAVLGLALAAVGVAAVHRLGPGLTPHLAQRFREVTIDRAALLGCVGLSGACTLFFGALPALLGSRTGAGAMQPVTVNARSGRRSRLIPLLLSAELALALMLLTSAGLLIHSFSRLMSVDWGFRPERVQVLTVSLPRDRYQGDPERWASLVDGVVAGLSEDARVEQAAVASNAGYGRSGNAGINDVPILLEGQADADRASGARILRASTRVTPGYLEMLGMHVVRGRSITTLDVPGMPLVAVVNETWARTYWPNQDPIGRRFRPGNQLIEVVGVVADARDFRFEPLPTFYAPLQQLVVGPQVPEGGLYLRVVVRARQDAAAAEAAAREVLGRLAPEAAVGFAEPWDSEVERAALREPRFQALVFGAFGLIATVIAAVGVFGVLSYMVSQRTHEIGVRLALGGHPAQIARLVVKQVAALATLGLVLGWVGSLAAAKLLRAQLFGITPTDGASHLGASAMLLTTAVLAAILPLRRATSVDPVTILKAQ